MRLVVTVSNHAVRRALGAVALLGMVGGAYFIGSARADGIPTVEALFYSGLLEESGVPAEGDRAVVVRLFDAPSGGAERCNTSVTASFTLGRFRIPLTGACVTAIHSYANLYAEVSVGALTLPRTKLGAVPYAVEADRAMLAEVANDADLLDGVDSVSFAQASHTHDTAALTSGTLPINRGGTAINTVSGNQNRLMGVRSDATGYDLKLVSGDTGEISVTSTTGSLTVGLANGVPRSCSYEQASTATSNTTVSCPAGKFVVGGGGACAPSNDQGSASENRLKYSRPSDAARSGWNAICTVTDGSKSTWAYAICCTE